MIATARGSYYDMFKRGEPWEPAKRGLAGIVRYLRARMDKAHEGTGHLDDRGKDTAGP